MPRILEADALKLAQNISALEPEDQKQAAGILQQYKEQQEAEGLPHWPQLMADQEQETRRFRSMFENLSNVDGVAPAIAPVVKFAADPDEHRARVATTAFLATRYGKSADEVANAWELYADDYAAKTWNEATPLDSKRFYARAKTEIQGEIDRDSLTESLGEAVTKAALLNDKTAWQAWKDSAVTHPGWKPELESQLFDAWRAADKKIKADMGENAALIRRTVESLQSKTGVEGNAAEWTHPEYDLRELLITDPAGYKKALRLIGRVATVAAKDNKDGVLGWFQKAGESLARGVEGIGEGFVADAQRGASAVAGVVGAEDTAKLNDASIRVARDLRDIANGVVDPVKRNNWLDTMIFGGLESAPSMVAGMAGPLNAGLVLKGQYASDAEKAFEEHGWTGAGSKAAAQAVGVAAAAVESMSEMFGATKWGKAAMKAIGAGPESKFATRYLVNSALRGASEFSEEIVQDNLAAATQSMLNAVGASVGAPAPFMEEVSGWIKTQGTDTALVVLPLALLGAGLTTSQEIGEAKANAIIGDVSQTAKLIGREAAERVAAISDPQARAAEFQKAYQSQSAKDRQEWLAASSELEKAKAEFAQATNTEAEAQALSITHDESGWRLNMADGGTVRVDSAQAAVSLRSDLMQARSDDEARALVSVVEDWQKNAPADTKRETNFTGEQVKLGSDGQLIGERAGGDVRVIDSPKLLQDIRSQAQSTGLGAEIDLVVNGSNSVFAQSVNEASRQIVQRLEINRSNEQAPIITVLHEQLEANLKAANLGGVVSTQETMSALARVADALPVADAQQRLASLERRKAPQSHIEEARRELDLRQRIQAIANGEGDEAAMREIAVELAVADVIARDKSGMKTGLRAGSVSAALDSAISKAVTPGEVRALGKFRAFLRSVRAWVRSVLGTVAGFQKARRDGKLTDGDAWNAWLDKVTGVTEQARYDQELADELKAIAGQDDAQYSGPGEGQAFSLSRAVPADTSNVTEMPDGAQLVGPTTFSITAYHGTPHKVGRFSLDKIGTGEGAQAYGWGLYMAESKAVAEGYRKNISQSAHHPILEDDGNYYLRDARTGQKKAGPFNTRAEAESLAQGNLYTVELLPDESEFLDWDKPLSEQPGKVREAIKAIKSNTPKDMLWMWDGVTPQTPGRQLYGMLGELAAEMNPEGADDLQQAASELMLEHGIPGLRYLDGNSRGNDEGTHNYVIWDENLVRILEENGKPVEARSFSLSRVTPAQDAEYMRAVESGDMESAQRMVDEAAKGEGPFFHRSGAKGIKEFYPWTNFGTEEQAASVDLTGRSDGDSQTYKVYLDIRNPLRVEDQGMSAINVLEQAMEMGIVSSKEYSAFPFNQTDEEERAYVIKVLKSKGYDGLVYENKWEGEGDSFVAFNPSQIKSADPVTYDDAGNVIPLSQRFNPADDRITFSLSPARNLELVQSAIDSQLSRDPDKRLQLAAKAKSKLEALRDRWESEGWTAQGGYKRAIVEKRSKASLDSEQAVRQALRVEELVNEGLSTLSPQQAETYYNGVQKLEDHPLVSAMLNDQGRLMSRTTAEAQGKLKTDGKGNAGDYDTAPWLPPSWYRNGGGIMPDSMAKALYDDGKLNDSTPDALWSALSSVIESQRKAKASFDEAAAAVREISKQANEQARSEAQAWRDEQDAMQSKDWNPRAALVRDLQLLDSVLSVMPPEVRGKVGGFVKLAQLATEDARVKELQRRVSKLDVVLERYLADEYRGQIKDLFDNASPNGSAGKKPKGKIGADEHEIFKLAEEASKLDGASVDGLVADLNNQIADERTPDERRDALTKAREIVQLVGDMKHADSAQLAAAHDALASLYTNGLAEEKLRQAKIRERRAAFRSGMVEATGKDGTRKQRVEKEAEARKFLGLPIQSVADVFDFEQVLRYAFGDDSQEARHFYNMEANASGAYLDSTHEVADKVEAFFVQLAGKGGVIGGESLPGEQLRWKMGNKRTIDGGKAGPMTELEAIQALLMWQQEDGRRHMEGKRDESGKPVSSWSYDQAWIDSIKSQLSPQAQMVKSFIEKEYGSEYSTLNALYRERHGVNLPRHDRYAPITVKPMEAKSGEVVDPVTGSVAAGNGSLLTPGSLRTRSRSAIAEPDFRDALATMIAHKKQLAWWSAYYDLAVDLNATIGNREVVNAVEASSGRETAAVLKKWRDYFATGGFRDAASGLEINSMMGRAINRAAQVRLFGRLSTILVQITQLGAASVKMSPGAFMLRFGKLLSGQLSWGDAYRSDFIQRRLREAPPIVQQALARIGTTTSPNALRAQVKRAGNLLSGSDALWTAGTYAMILDHQRAQGAKMRLEGDELERFAHSEAERLTEQVAQPTRAARRSIFELSAGAPAMRSLWAFSSESRQKIAIGLFEAFNPRTKGFDKTKRVASAAALIWLVSGLVPALMKAALKSPKGDDDDWDLKKLALRTASGPIGGLPFVDSIIDGRTMANVGYAPSAIKHLATGNEEDITLAIRDVATVLQAAGMFHEDVAAAGVIANAVSDAADYVRFAATGKEKPKHKPTK